MTKRIYYKAAHQSEKRIRFVILSKKQHEQSAKRLKDMIEQRKVGSYANI